MNRPVSLFWTNFAESVLVSGEQRVHRVSASPRIEIFGDGVANRVGLRLEVSPDSTLPAEAMRLEYISSTLFKKDGLPLMELASTVPALNRQFYLFSVAVADRVLNEGMTPTSAVALEVQSLQQLVDEKRLLGVEGVLGLLGELLVLEKLISFSGPSAVLAWIGPLGEPHDFRINKKELEVKTTAGSQRIHTIHGLTQLMPSPGCSLSLVSILLGPAGQGGGGSLAGIVTEITKLVAPDTACALQFERALEAQGYRASDEGQYMRKFALRRPIATVPVDATFPVISREMIQKTLGSAGSRVGNLQYEVNVEGLENETAPELSV